MLGGALRRRGGGCRRLLAAVTAPGRPHAYCTYGACDDGFSGRRTVTLAYLSTGLAVDTVRPWHTLGGSWREPAGRSKASVRHLRR